MTSHKVLGWPSHAGKTYHDGARRTSDVNADVNAVDVQARARGAAA